MKHTTGNGDLGTSTAREGCYWVWEVYGLPLELSSEPEPMDHILISSSKNYFSWNFKFQYSSDKVQTLYRTCKLYNLKKLYNFHITENYGI